VANTEIQTEYMIKNHKTQYCLPYNITYLDVKTLCICVLVDSTSTVKVS